MSGGQTYLFCVYVVFYLYAILREFVFNSRHPGPRRVWKGGSEPRLLTPDPVAPLAPVAPVANSKIVQLAVIYHTW